MKKIFFLLFFFTLVGCVGYEPLFSVKKLSFYIKDIENINNDPITKKISKNLGSSKVETDNKKVYLLKISSKKDEAIMSKNSRGQAITYQMSIEIMVKVFSDNKEFPLKTLKFKDSFIYNNQSNKFDLNQYKKNIEKNIINKISQEITIKLQSL